VAFMAANALTGLAITSLTVLPVDQPPIASLVVTPPGGAAPLAVTADASGSSDPDGNVVSYHFDFGDGTMAVGPQASPTATHTYAKGGNWTLTLSVTDNAGIAASTSTRVLVTGTTAAPPVAALVLSPTSGVAPLPVTADASGSSAVGPIASYRFDFGDGTVVGPQVGATASHTYAAGSWMASVRVTDSNGATASASASVSVATSSDPVTALPNLVKNPSFEAGTGGWVSFYGSTIQQVAGGHDGAYALQMTGTAAIDYGFGVNDHPDWIHPTTAAGKTYRYTAWVRSAASQGTARIRVREYLLSSAALLGQISSPGVRLTPAWQQLIVDYTTLSAGSSLDMQVKDNPLMADEVFLTDDIGIRDITGVPGITPAQGGFDPDAGAPKNFDGDALSFRSVLYPSPVQTSAVLSFATTRVGALRVDLVDLAGREVRHLYGEAQAPAGMHALTIDGIRDDGRRMSPGLYFYRIVADEGQMTGRFVTLR